MSAPKDHFAKDEDGRTALFAKAEPGDMESVREIIYSLMGTGLSPQRLALICRRDRQGLTAIDVARNAGHQEIADLLAHERTRMEYFE